MIVINTQRVDAFRAPADIDEHMGERALKSLHLPAGALRDWRILAKSVDSRGRVPVLLYSLLLDLDDRFPGAARLEPACAEAVCAASDPQLELPEQHGLLHPIVVGTGPGGIFCALTLAMAGAEPIVLDAGQDVETRYADYRSFLAKRELNETSNLLIGEGGAGTFSDGKLYTGTKDKRAAFVLAELASGGNAPEIRYTKRPHIGSDRLRTAAAKLRHKIIELGGEFHFGTKVVDLVVRDGFCRGVVTASGETMEAPCVLIAPGLGGRDLVGTLEKYADHDLKSFQIGCRIEHPQALIDDRQFHLAGRPRPAALGAAEYHMVSRPVDGAANVSSFCMCPGGELLNATAWRGQSVTNGMSDSARSGEFANGCLIMTLPPDRFASPAEARELFTRLEQRCFEMGGCDYTLPAQDAVAFLGRRAGLRLRKTGCATGIVPGRIDELIPQELYKALRAALKHFDHICPGFIGEGKLVGLETCVSSPVRFIRDPETLCSSVKGLYLCGEGTGAAGGIMSAAVDGVKLAEAMLSAKGK